MPFKLLVPKRTHQITVQSVKGCIRESKSFSIYTTEHSNQFLFREINKLFNSKKLNRKMIFEVKDCSHVVILSDLRESKHYSKCFPLHQYSVEELGDILKKHFIGGDDL